MCNPATFRLISGIDTANGWRLEVLPPAETDPTAPTAAWPAQGVNALARPTLTGR